jgi:uncharacterized membrane protein
MALGLLLLLAMAFSGHAAAAQASGGLGSFAVPVDWLHLLSTSLWVGGIIFIALMLMPAIWGYESPDRARTLVTLLPRFSVVALASVTVAALSGSFNADVHLTSWSQFVDTTYGRTLIVKILLVSVMILISAYHAFRVRPALSRALGTWDRLPGAVSSAEAGAPAQAISVSQEEQSEAQSVGITGAPQANQQTPGRGSGPQRRAIPMRPFTLPSLSAVNAPQQDDPLETADLTEEDEEAPQATGANGYERQAQRSARALARIERLSETLRLWIRREALLGVGVLLCASLLGGFAGSLSPLPPGAAPNINAPTLSSTTKTPVDMTQTVKSAQQTLRVTLKVAPDKFGTNSVGVLLVDTKTGKPIDGANVHLIVNMVEMDMGTSTSDPKGSGGGFYTGQIDLLMGGHWTVQVQIRTPQNPNVIQRATFTFPVTF